MSIIGKTKTNKAFTLIEIMLVVIIIGIILAMATPNFSKGYSRFLLNKTADDLLGVSRWAQAMAIGQERIYALSFSNDHRSYRLMRMPVNDGSSDQNNFETLAGTLGQMHKIAGVIHLNA